MLPMRLWNSASSFTRTGVSTATSCGGMCVAALMGGYQENRLLWSRIVQSICRRYAKKGSLKGSGLKELKRLTADQVPLERRAAFDIANRATP